MKKYLPLAFLCLVAPVLARPQPAGQDSGMQRTSAELMLADVKHRKTVILSQNLPLTEAESAAFWPLHREYEADLDKLSDRKIGLIRRYAAHYGTMTDREAAALVAEAFEIEERNTALKRGYFRKMSRILPATKAARFFQIEAQLNQSLDLQLRSSLPLIE
jgi:hypothetical protein